VADRSAVEILGPDGAVARRLSGYEHRSEQLEMAALVERAIEAGRHLAVEAGTGTGKSLAYLVPILLSGKRVICSTANKALQEQIALKDLPFLQGVLPKPFRAVVLKGRRNYVCLQRLDELRQRTATLPGMEFAGKSVAAAQAWPRLANWAADQERSGASGDLDLVDFSVPPDLRDELTVDSDNCIGEKCPARERCFAERARAAAQRAEVVIVNHALLLSSLELTAATEGQLAVLPDADICVVDEAQHLEEMATNAFGCEVTEFRWSRLAGLIDRLTVRHPAVHGQDETGETARAAIRAAHAVERAGAPTTASPQEWRSKAQEWQLRVDLAGRAFLELMNLLTQRCERAGVQRLGDDADLAAPAVEVLGTLALNMQEGTPTWLTEPQRESWQRLGGQVQKLALDLRRLARPVADGSEVRFAQWEGPAERRRLHLYAKPVDVSAELREKLFATYPTVVATSATLATDGNISYWRGRVGLDQADELVLDSPFDFRRNALIYLPPAGSSFDPSLERGPSATQYLDRLADEIEALVIASRGRAFVLFTSTRALNQLHQRLAPRLRRFSVLKQGELPRAELVRRFRQSGNGVLFGTRSFWEGVDVSGEALSLVIIDKLPFVPPDDPVFDARKEYVNRQHPDERGWAWWDRLAVPLVTITLKQGFGRLIRGRTDRGVVALLDGRLTTKRYGRRILASLPPAPTTRSLDEVREFFAR
jgi:ATP-dependent DNA helicase DinG